MKNYILLLTVPIFLFSCKKAHLQDHKHGSANEHMHKSSIESLIANFESPERDAYQQPDKVIAYLGPLKGLKIMDIGAGSGYFTFRLAQAGAKVIAADVNEEFQAFIKKKIIDYKLDSLDIELRKLPLDSPLLKPGEVDKVLVVNTFHHIEDRAHYFKQVHKGLKPGGELIVIDYFKKKIPVGPPTGHKISHDIVETELKAAGFSNIEVNLDLLKYQYVIRTKL